MIVNTPVLIDFDGVLRLGNKPAKDAGGFLKFLADEKIPSHIISNSTLMTAKELIKFLADNNIDFGIPAMTAADAALHYAKDHFSKVSVYCIPSIKKLFNDFIDDENPEAVLVGDNGNNWDAGMLNEIFRKVKNGAQLVAMHKNRYWAPKNGKLVLDAGAYIKAIEYGAEREAILIGKPSPVYFGTALNLLGYSLDDEFFMIGDDLESDIGGAQKYNGKGVLIYTGKTRYPVSKDSKIKPDLGINSLKEMIEILKQVSNY